MAGGTFKISQPKARPGVYVNLRNGKAPKALSSARGTASIPLIGYDWGPREQWIKLSVNSPDAEKSKLGRSIYDDNGFMLMLQLLFAGATTVYVYITDGGTKAKKEISIASSAKMTATAKYKGSLGNKIQIVSVANPEGGFDVSIHLNNSEVEKFEMVKVVDDLIGKSDYVDFSGSGTLSAFASSTLEGGTDTADGNASITKYLDMVEKVKANTICFPSEDSSLHKALLSKIRYIRNNIGWKVQAVTSKFDADYEGIINLVNSFAYEGRELSVIQACAWVTGMTAGAEYTDSLTYKVVADADRVVGEMNNEESIAAIKAGQTFFSVDDNGNVILEYDINSKVTFGQDDPTDLNKNRPLRVYDTFANDLMMNFVPGKYDANPDGFKVITGLGRTMLQNYEADGALKNVDTENDFIIDETRSTGDSVYVTVGLQAVDSADKYYFDVIAR